MARHLRSLIKAATSLALVVALSPLAAAEQGKGGGHFEIQTVVLMDMILERGPECGVIAPWEAEILRLQTRDLYGRFEPERRPALEQEARERAAALTCESPEIVLWPPSQRELWATQELPKYLAPYRAFALMNEPPAAFTAATERADYGRAIRAIDTHFVSLEVDGLEAPGGRGWFDYLDLMDRMMAPRAQAPTEDQVEHMVEAATITELWLDTVLDED